DSQSRFAAEVADEMREPLRSLAGQVGLLLARPDVPAEVARILAGVRETVLQVARFAGSLHEVAHSDRLGSLRELIDLEELLAEVHGLARARLGPRCDVACRVAGRPFVVGDVAELREVLRLLLDRVASALPAGRRVVMSADAHLGGVCITVGADEPRHT